ncbi:hematopoietic SH2 domain-containing protein isoform X1 [Lagenorhynchus albirostris]|uniref:hematopoietic SH2 domain-containing protein isoform X1 n=1 Tax=Lagenorhynchus albirostris TaxID=27610 RepID=UPI0028E539ED|nr:hematopoietic SH2 domain-containing protein isoform X1 [Lagenorhynchus albirostris]
MTEARKLPPPLPPRLDWFVQTQVDQLTCGGVPEWFHGAISREDAENLLESQPLGSFLIRVSHSHVGYTLSYKAQNCCRHFMVKLLDDGSFIIPGEERAHASLVALVTFHQQQPLRPHGDLLTQPSQQKDPANADYKDLFLFSDALAEEATSSALGLSKYQNPSSCPMAPLEEAFTNPVLLHRRKEGKPLAEPDGASTEKATPSCPPKSPLEEARQKIWRNLKILPRTGKKVQQELKSQLVAASSSLWDAKPLVVTHDSGAGAGDSAWKNNVFTDPQAPRNRDEPSRKASRSASWSETSSRVRDWHQAVVRALSSHVSKPEPRGSKEPQDCLPEEYRSPPPFAPGYC